MKKGDKTFCEHGANPSKCRICNEGECRPPCSKKQNKLEEWRKHVVKTYDEVEKDDVRPVQKEVESDMDIFFIFKKIWKGICWVLKKIRNIFFESQGPKV